jgi:hypothetical protein
MKQARQGIRFCYRPRRILPLTRSHSIRSAPKPTLSLSSWQLRSISSQGARPDIGDSADDVHDLGAEAFGSFSVVFPPEPYQWGTSHIHRELVPPHVLPHKCVPSYVHAPPDAPFSGDPWEGDGRIDLQGGEARRLRDAGVLAAHVLHWAGGLVQVSPHLHVCMQILIFTVQAGRTTEEIDAKVRHYVISHGAYPSPLGYAGFPKSCCTSVNNIIAHGIPDEYVRREAALASCKQALVDMHLTCS